MPTSAAVLYTLMGVRSILLMMNISDSPPQKLGRAARWQYLQARSVGKVVLVLPKDHHCTVQVYHKLSLRRRRALGMNLAERLERLLSAHD